MFTCFLPPIFKRSTIILLYGKRVMITDGNSNSRRRNNSLFARTLSQLPKSIINSNSVTINSKRRKIPLTFLPPSTKSPLFVYNNDYDQRSFLSLRPGSHLDSERDEESAMGEDNESVSTFRSLPSTLERTDDDLESIHQWLDEERERRSLLNCEEIAENYGATSDGEENVDRAVTQAGRLFKDTGSRCSSIFGIQELIEEEEEEDFAGETTTMQMEMKKLSRYSVPLIITFFLEQIFSLVCVVFVGHLGKEELAAVSMASMTSTIVLAIFEGISTSLDTLCPQAYGAGQYNQVGIHCQRCSLFSLALFIPAALFWFYIGFFLKYIIHDERVVMLTQQFLRILIFGGPPYILFESGKRFLQAQGIFDAGTIILFITAPLNVFLNWLLVYSESFGVGYIGAPIAAVVNFWSMFILLVLYVVFVDGSECWDGFSKSAFHQWYDLSLLAIPGIVMLLAESMAYELLTLLASYFGTGALASQSALSSVVSLLYMIPFAISVASSTRIANFVGAGNVRGGKIASKVGLICSILVSAVNSLIIYFGSESIARLFTEDEEVILMFINLCPLVSVYVIFDGLACVASGILRALALQIVGGTINLFGYYAIAFPLAYFLSFKCGLKLIGLWLGNGSGLLTIGILEIYVIYKADWTDIVEKARLRAMNDSKSR